MCVKTAAEVTAGLDAGFLTRLWMLSWMESKLL